MTQQNCILIKQGFGILSKYSIFIQDVVSISLLSFNTKYIFIFSFDYIFYYFRTN